jgi:hypothetical protein
VAGDWNKRNQTDQRNYKIKMKKRKDLYSPPGIKGIIGGNLRSVIKGEI